MDRSAVQAIVEREIGGLIDRFGLGHWRISLNYDLRKGDEDSVTRGLCTLMVDHERARLSFDPDALDDEAAVLDTLRHELFHVVLAPFEVYADAVRPLIERDETTAAIVASVRTFAIEQAVICLERLYCGLTEDRPKAPVYPDGNAPPAIS